MDAVTENLHTLVKASMDRGRLVEANYALDAIAEISALRAAADGAAVGTEWQPISTAPAHPTHFLIWLPGDDELGYYPTVHAACRMRTSGEIQSVGFCAPMDDGIEPTCWMPFPEPPADVGAAVGAGEDPLGDEY